MAKLDAAFAEIEFDGDFTGDVGLPATLLTEAALFEWQTSGGHVFTAEGSGFTYGAVVTVPTGGVISGLSLDFVDGGHPAGVNDVTITGLMVPLTVWDDPVADFWAAVLGGDDTVLAPIYVGGAIFGDFFEVTAFKGGPSVTMNGGHDKLSSQAFNPVSQELIGEGVFANVLAGDALKVIGNFFPFPSPTYSYATLNGGDDVFTIAGPSTYAVAGDAQLVNAFGILNGGGDEIASDAGVNTSLDGFIGHYFGDAELSHGTVNGGDDVITGSNQVFASEHMAGDVYRQRSGGVAVGGDDLISGRRGQDTIAGDVFYLSSGELTGGADTISGGNDADLISGDVLACRETGVDKVSLKITGGNDTVDGGAGDDYITGDIYHPLGLAPDDAFIAGSDTLLGGSGDDTIYGDVMSFFEALVDVGGDDRIDGGLGDDLLDGGKGEDTLLFATKGAAVTVDLSGASAIGQGTDYVVGFERVEGTNSGDKITGDDFNNDLIGLAGDDALNGLGGTDFLAGEQGADRLSGGDGFDIFHCGNDSANDVFSGGKGRDAIAARTVLSGITVTFSKANAGVMSSATSGTDRFSSIGGIDLSEYGDVVGAGAGSNVFEMAGGNDTADGGGGNDILEGEAGDDRLNGGLGNDELFGGTGVDTFVFDTALDGVNNVDVVTDYSLAGDYPVELGSSVFTGLALGALSNAAFRAGTGLVAAADASDRIVYDSSTGALYFDADGLGGLGAVKFAVFSGIPQLAAFNFTVV